jgi:Protein of unknown function (DUF2946)
MATFDESVLRAMQKWPEVPNCVGWLSLDRRGRWLLQGEPIHHARTISFFNRHYSVDEAGRWFVQNGPQRVFVDLAAAPYCVYFSTASQLITHTGTVIAAISSVIATNLGELYLVGEFGLALLLDRDLSRFVDQLCDANGRPIDTALEQFIADTPAPCAADAPNLTLYWQRGACTFRRGLDHELPQTYGFSRKPQLD